MNSIKTQINFRFKAQTQNQITLKLRNYLIKKLHQNRFISETINGIRQHLIIENNISGTKSIV